VTLLSTSVPSDSVGSTANLSLKEKLYIMIKNVTKEIVFKVLTVFCVFYGVVELKFLLCCKTNEK
jgi:hypothetical protein